MFTAKKTRLFSHVAAHNTTTSASSFVQAAKKKGAETTSANGALKYKSTGNSFTDQFGKLSEYKAPRSFEDIQRDCEALWSKDALLCVVFIIYIRMITRVVNLFSGVSTKASQKGAELKHEGIFRMIWLHMKSPESFWKNIELFVSAGSWKDVFTMLQYDLEYHGWEGRILDWKKFGELLLSGLENPSTSNLVKKYLPQIKSRSACTTLTSQADNLISKWICSLLFTSKGSSESYNYKRYRQLKTSGNAHEWQKLISQKKFDRIDFGKIHGRALSLLVRSKFLKNQNLSEKYAAWIGDAKTVAVKYTGFVHELFKGHEWDAYYKERKPMLSSVPKHVQDTINKQFMTLVEKGRTITRTTSFIVVRDTSGSMRQEATGTGMTAYSVGKAIALYFSYFLKGHFKDAWIEFNSTAQLHEWEGNTPIERWYNDSSSFYGSTEFLSVIQLFCKLRSNGIEESEFPTGILCISDGEFNPAYCLTETNVNNSKKLLRNYFSKEYVDNFVIVLWNLSSRANGNEGVKFDSYGNVPNVFYFGGYNPATISFLDGNVKTAMDLFSSAMDQELLNMVEI